MLIAEPSINTVQHREKYVHIRHELCYMKNLYLIMYFLYFFYLCVIYLCLFNYRIIHYLFIIFLHAHTYLFLLEHVCPIMHCY
jgi:hypothetical protein